MQEIQALVDRVKVAQRQYAEYNQERVDNIFKAVAIKANNLRIPLAEMAVEETGMGVMEDKAIKNHYAAEYIYNAYKEEKTCGEIERDEASGIIKIAEPIGVIGAVIPTTNPTSTTIFKILIALKTRNGLIVSPHPRAKNCTVETAKLLLETAVEAGAPKDIIAWVDEPSLEKTDALMKSVDLILATGGPQMVKAAYSSGKPAIGVGAGNTPAYIDKSANIPTAVSSIIHSKIFDNGVICASEQAVIIDKSVYGAVKEEFIKLGGYVLSKEETDIIRGLSFGSGKLNANIVGKSAQEIAKLAGLEIDPDRKLLIAEVEKTDISEPLAGEKLSPILAMYSAENFDDGLNKADELVRLGGMGHTACIYLDDQKESALLDRFAERIKTCRILVNTPASQGGIGDLYNFRLPPSLTLGCGSWGGNSVSENVGVKQLLNIKTVAKKRENMLWFRAPEKIYFKRGCLSNALKEIKDEYKRKRAFIVTDGYLYTHGACKKVTDDLDKLGITHTEFFEVEPDPTLETVQKGVERMRAFSPDCIIALGGGSPMDAGKIMWLMYEREELSFSDLAMRFMDIRKRVFAFPKLGEKAIFIAIPTTAGTGSEVTPFAVITDEKTGAKYPLADYSLMPTMAISDIDFMLDIPPTLTANAGFDALSHAIEAVGSMLSTDYTDGLAIDAIKLLVAYLPHAFLHGKGDITAREKVANAATMAGLAFANAFLGICHSLAHKLGAYFHIPHGLANALLLKEVMKFNAEFPPAKMGTFPQYPYPVALKKYAKIAKAIGLVGETDKELFDKLLDKIDEVKSLLKMPKTIKEALGGKVKKEEFFKAIDRMSKDAFDDQCTGANPRYPLVTEIRTIYEKCWDGK